MRIGYHVIGLGRSEIPYDEFSIDEYVKCDLANDDVRNISFKITVPIDAVNHWGSDLQKEPYCELLQNLEIT